MASMPETCANLAWGLTFVHGFVIVDLMRKINIALIGCGFLGQRHLKTLHTLKNKANTVAICDHHPGNAKALGKQYHVPVFTDYHDIPGHIDAVSICTPT